MKRMATMTPLPPALTRDLVLVGGGHAHALALRMWAMDPLPGVRLTLISPEPVAAYSGMLPGVVAGHYPAGAIELDLVRLAGIAGARLILAPATGIDRAARRVMVAGRAPVAYDLLSLDIGITTAMPDLPGFAEHGVPAKPLDAFAAAWEAFMAARPRAARVVVIGGGIAGVELALAAKRRSGAGSGAEVTIVERDRALAAVGKGARAALLAHLVQAGVTLREGQAAVAVEAGAVLLADGTRLPSDFTLGAARATAQEWPGASGLAVEPGGFVRVLPSLQTETDPLIFATGDMAHMTASPRPKAGVFAVRQAPVLFHNLRAALAGRPLRPYRPQRDYLKLISTGGKGAVADKWGLRLDGAWLWRWKDRIDRRFMAMFQDLPATDAPKPHADDPFGGRPLCGGCGAKVGRGALLAALDGLPAPARADVIAGAGDDAAILAMGGRQQVITTDHLRAFWADPWLMARLTAIHAMGDIWSMGAEAQAALSQITLPPMDERLQGRTVAEILDAAVGVFGPEGADLVGGHTTLGAEMVIGFTLTGLADRAIRQGGARVGDVLILTKPVGSGLILAAAMAGRAPGRVVAGALASMARPQGDAARVLAPVAHAMTDVTGFGLAGHLLAMAEASGLRAVLDLSAVPVLPGAEALAAAGEGSSLLPANRAAAAKMFFTPGPRADLLFDPQTAGGLLAAVAPEAADGLVARLRAMGEGAALIGRFEAGDSGVTVA